uniref:SCP domain-containing protein n=1 Tax=Strongyloides papillosus TaxID=174720 RepID=A0A0N5B1Z8_STREA
MNPPPLPPKQRRYDIKGGRVVARPKLLNLYRVKSSYTNGIQIFECDDMLFYNYSDAEKYCYIANKYGGSVARRDRWHFRPSLGFSKTSISRSNIDLSKRKKIVLGSSNLSMGRKNSLSKSSGSLSGFSRSSSRESLTKSHSDLSSSRNSMLRSNTHLSPSGKIMSKSSSDLLKKRNSISGSSFDLSEGKNYISKSSYDLSGRRNSITKSKESLNNNAISDKDKKDPSDEYFVRKPTSSRIWHKVWEYCSFKCYSKNHYDKLKLLMLKEINMYRSLHRVEHLVTTQQLTELAQVLADKYALKRTLEVDKRFAYGILHTYVPAFSASVIVRNWYETNAKYNFLLGPKSKVAKNFAQLVWKSTNQIGIGVQVEDGFLYVVCVFFPKGNKKGEYRNNVLKRKT